MSAPEVGWWLIRVVKGGPLTPARIFWCDHEPGEPDNRLDRWPIPFLSAEIAGEPAEIDAIWLTRGEPITEAEYQFRVADTAWAKRHAPHLPEAQPHKPMRLADAPIPFGDET